MRITLSLAKHYVAGWGLWEVIREFIQNALDEHDQGCPMNIERGKGRGGSIRITNQGARLSRKTLLLGGGNKADDSSRGKFGEGYKLAMLVCARLGIPCRIWTGTEIWAPVLAPSDDFGGAETLQVDVRRAKTSGRVVVEIGNVSDADWQMCQNRILTMRKLKQSEAVAVGQDQILCGECHRGQLYARGIWVGAMSGCYTFGYDLADVELDRDRKMADEWSLQHNIANVLQSASERGLLPDNSLTSIVLINGGEARALLGRFQSDYYGSSALTKQLTKSYHAQHGDSVPCSTHAEKDRIEHHGLKAVICDDPTRYAVEVEVGTLDTRLQDQALSTTKVYTREELTEEERATYGWAYGLVCKVEENMGEFGSQVVDFISEDVLGTHQDKRVRIARKVLASKADTIRVFVHEVAHVVGADGTYDHITRIEQLHSQIIAGLAE